FLLTPIHVVSMLLAGAATGKVHIPRPRVPLTFRTAVPWLKKCEVRVDSTYPQSRPTAVDLRTFLTGIAACTHGGPLHRTSRGFRKWANAQGGPVESVRELLSLASRTDLKVTPQFDVESETRGSGALEVFVPLPRPTDK
ncbi:MAG: hypothetical protein QG597_1761, partial [Actinomycetota bacterium]|nr:hypothetical protein [Actinomycetota bacterium]